MWLDEDALEVLPSLQYSLHRAGELFAGIEPPEGAEAAHLELAAALEEARDSTGDVREALEADGPDAASALVHEWRGALFRVRLARHRLAIKPPRARARRTRTSETAELAFTGSAALSTALVLSGTVAFTAGAVLALWPLWAFGLGLVSIGFLAYRS